MGNGNGNNLSIKSMLSPVSGVRNLPNKLETHKSNCLKWPLNSYVHGIEKANRCSALRAENDGLKSL